MGYILTTIYLLAFFLVFLYSLTQFHLAIRYWIGSGKNKKINSGPGEFSKDAELPFVTIQLPIYNEVHVVERLLRSVCNIDYPKDKFEVQVLDDSDDETLALAKKLIGDFHQQGINIFHIRREDRSGYKAGALKYGMTLAKGDFFAIFDADFVPPASFLRQSLPAFFDEKVGAVQTKWTHLNEGYSLLTRVQAFALDNHFSVEQGGRSHSNYFLNFNGTSGIWRKEAIENAGGWQSDTLTEDLDLSYRAQLKGWKIFFTENASAPAELPAAINGVKSQQFRWTKGAAQNAKKNFRQVLKFKMPIAKKIHAIAHLFNSAMFICLFVAGVLSIPLFFLKIQNPGLENFLWPGNIFKVTTAILFIVYWTSNNPLKRNSGFPGLFKFILTYPLFLCISTGLSLHNALATLEGYIGKKSPFIRTPKFNLIHSNDTFKEKKYGESPFNFLGFLEVILFLAFTTCSVLSLRLGDWTFFPLHLTFAIGYGFTTFYSVVHRGNPALQVRS